MIVELPLYRKGYFGDSSAINSQRCINLFPEIVEGEVDSKIALINTSGLRKLGDIGTGPIRGMVEHLGDVFVVSRNELYKYTTTGTKTLIGTLNTSGGSVSMASNGVSGGEIIIVDGVDGWTYDGTTLATISDADFPVSPTKVIFFDGYFIVLDDNSDYFYLSAAYDGTSWSNLDKARTERDPDNILAVAAHDRMVWFIGETTTELWYNSGNDFPFDPVPNSIIEVGIHAPDSLSHLGDEGLIWLASDEKGKLQVVKSEGTKVKSVTPSSIQSIFETYSTTDDAISFAYQERGHIFYQLTFQTEKKTWVYDVTSDAWHEKKDFVALRHRAQNYIFFNKMHTVGDFENGNIYELDINTYTDNSETIYREFTTSHVADKGQLLRHNYLELVVETGATALLSGQGYSPIITMEFSDDDGNTWSNARSRSLGVQGAYKQNIRWTHLGTTRNRVYKFKLSDPIRIRIKALLLSLPDEKVERST